MFSRYLAPRFFKSLGYQCLLTRHQVSVFDRYGWRFELSNSEFGIRNSELRGDEMFSRYLAPRFFLKALVINAF